MAVKKRISSATVKRYIGPVFEKYSRTDGGGRMNVKSIVARIGLIRRDEAEKRGEDVEDKFAEDFAPSGNTVRSVLQQMIRTGKHVSSDSRQRNVRYSYRSTEHLDKIENEKNDAASQHLMAQRLTEALGLPFDPDNYREAGEYEEKHGGTVRVSLTDLARMVDLVEHYTKDEDEVVVEEKKSVREYDALEDRY